MGQNSILVNHIVHKFKQFFKFKMTDGCVFSNRESICQLRIHNETNISNFQ